MSLSEQQLASQKNLSWILAGKLAQRIFRGEYQPGSILPGEIELGELFGVSRTAIREAVKTLAAKGMVLPRPRIGTRVLPRSHWNFLDTGMLSWWMTDNNSFEVIDHFLVMRSALEPEACALAAIHGSGEDKARLGTLMNEMYELQKDFDRERWVEVDMDYHELIYAMSNNPFISSFANLFRPVYLRYFSSVTYDEVVKLSHHREVVDAIIEGDGPAARAACLDLLNAPVPHPTSNDK
ncbi:GntR family transcriptional regulator [Salmonella enterica subsp. enterica serovar Choleraesuis]|nr:GntR family transcriptional regulator [Salmonella enterica subsp. enterica serovar Choleraesuis]